MYILRIEHLVSNFDGWKKAFDNDPIGRSKMGVRRFRISRGLDDSNYVIVDLEFDTADQAQSVLLALQGVWNQVQGKLIYQPKSLISMVVETVEL